MDRANLTDMLEPLDPFDFGAILLRSLVKPVRLSEYSGKIVVMVCPIIV